jgi:hypothetical protein
MSPDTAGHGGQAHDLLGGKVGPRLEGTRARFQNWFSQATPLTPTKCYRRALWYRLFGGSIGSCKKGMLTFDEQYAASRNDLHSIPQGFAVVFSRMESA